MAKWRNSVVILKENKLVDFVPTPDERLLYRLTNDVYVWTIHKAMSCDSNKDAAAEDTVLLIP
ncbi:hypothetical protein J6590_030110 [Homalodisca vitripennis]|nr:hypothetical protein J6590_030110 [Homalodisca vitripennis]